MSDLNLIEQTTALKARVAELEAERDAIYDAADRLLRRVERWSSGAHIHPRDDDAMGLRRAMRDTAVARKAAGLDGGTPNAQA